jgi:hypothetical protein
VRSVFVDADAECVDRGSLVLLCGLFAAQCAVHGCLQWHAPAAVHTTQGCALCMGL